MKAKKLISIILALVMLTATIPFAFAADAETPHKHGFKINVTIEPECEKDGRHILLCVCGATEIEKIPATGHTPDPTTGTCKVCGAEIKEEEPSDALSILQKVIKFFSEIFSKIVALLSKAA